MFRTPQALDERGLRNVRDHFQKFEAIKDYSKYKMPEAAKLSKMLNARIVLDKMTETKSDFGLLDPSGKRDGAEIEATLRGFMRDHYVQEARDDLRVLTHGKKQLEVIGPDHYRKGIDNNLKKAGVGYSALDPDKKLGDFQAKHYIVEKAYKGAHLRCAQYKFQKLKDGIPLIEAAIAGSMGGKSGPDKLAAEIRQHIKKADTTLAALAPSGSGKSEREMAKELDAAVKNHEFRVDDKEEFREQIKILGTMPRGNGRGR